MTEPRRKSHRLVDFDYSTGRSYFITICTPEQAHLLGSIDFGELVPNRCGKIASEEWERTISMRKELVPHAFVVMPNHVHMLFSLDPEAVPKTNSRSTAPIKSFNRVPHSVSTMIGGYKGAVTRSVRGALNDPTFTVWQRDFYDHIVRDEKDFAAIEAYINENPARWGRDRFGPGIGDL